MQFRERSQKFFGQLPNVFRSESEKDKKLFLFTTLFSSKCSTGLLEQKFGCVAFFCRKSKIFFALTPKFFEKHFFVRKNISSVKTILSAWRKQFR